MSGVSLLGSQNPEPGNRPLFTGSAAAAPSMNLNTQSNGNQALMATLLRAALANSNKNGGSGNLLKGLKGSTGPGGGAGVLEAP